MRLPMRLGGSQHPQEKDEMSAFPIAASLPKPLGHYLPASFPSLRPRLAPKFPAGPWDTYRDHPDETIAEVNKRQSPIERLHGVQTDGTK
jgi:hypothetical protein